MKNYFSKTLKTSFDDAVNCVTKALKAEGFGILTETDVQATLKKKLNVDFQPYLILGACKLKTLTSRTLFMLLFLAPVLVFGQAEHQEQSPSPNIENHHGSSEKTSDAHEKKKDQQESPGQDKTEKQVEHKHDHGAHGLKGEAGYKKFIKWIGNFHPIFNHFPIALIVMTGLSELLFLWFPSPVFSNASRFMIIAAAITAMPAALFGLAYGYEANYTGQLSSVFWWHRFTGISTAILAVTSAVLKELHVRKRVNKIGYYYTALIISILFVTITGYLGGEMTFGLFHMFP